MCLVGIGVAVVVSVWARLNGLSFSSLTTDEYYFVSSIRRILSTGLPEFESGGFYTRGLLIQYLTAPVIWVSGSEELGVRLPSVVFGLSAAFVAFLYGRRTIGRPWGLVLAAMILLSSWEIEFSRFGRMYAGFQLATLALLVSLHDVIEKARGLKRYLPPLLGLAVVGTHALAIFLVALLYLPVLLPGRLDRFGGKTNVIRYSLAAAIPLFAALVLQAVDFRRLGVYDLLPADFSLSSGSSIAFPAFPFWQLGGPTSSLAAVGALLGLVAFGGWMLQRRHKIDESTVIAALCFASAAVHFLLLTAILGLVLVVRYGLPRSARSHATALRLGLAAAVVAVGWVAYAAWLTFGAGSRAWIAASGERLFSEAVLRAFVWPDPSISVLIPWLSELPVLAWLFAAAFLFQFISRARDPLPELVRNPAFLVGYVVLSLGLAEPTFVVTRYTYFIYPVALAMLILSVRDVARLLAHRLEFARSELALGVPLALLLFAFGGDFHPRHIAMVASYASTYRTGEFSQFNVTWYDRNDQRATAAFVDDNAAPSDLVILEEVPPVSHYLGHDHVVYLDRRGTRFPNVSRQRGALDLWSNRRLLSTPEELREYTRCAGAPVWLVRSIEEGSWLTPQDVWGPSLDQVAVVFTNPDESHEVLRVTLKDDQACQGEEDG